MADMTSGAKAGAALGSAIPGIGTAAGGIIGGIFGGIAGFFGGRSEKKKAEELMRQAYEEILAVGAPPETAKEIIFEKFAAEGMYTPEMEQELDLAVSKIAQIQENPELRDAQMSALNIIKQRAGGGLTAEDRAAFEKIRSQVRGDTRAKERQIISELAQRGQAGSGAELAARLAASQSGADLASQEGLDIAASASRNALEAAARSGALAGDIRGQEFDMERTKASAEDERNRFLFENSAALRARNIAARNLAQQSNLSERQRIAEANTAMTNAERLRQREAAVSDWANKLRYAQEKRDTMLGQSKAAAEKGSAQASNWQTGVGGVITGAGQLYDKFYGKQEKSTNPTNSDEWIKESENVYVRRKAGV